MKKLIDLFQTAVFTVPFLVIFAFIVFIIASIMGCQKPQKPKPIVRPTYRTQMSPAMTQFIYQEIIDTQPGGVLYKVYKQREDDGSYTITKITKEPDPFRKNQ